MQRVMSDTSVLGDTPVLMDYVRCIPQCQVNTLMETLTRGMRGFYSDPKNVDALNEWKRKKCEKRGATKQK